MPKFRFILLSLLVLCLRADEGGLFPQQPRPCFVIKRHIMVVWIGGGNGLFCRL